MNHMTDHILFATNFSDTCHAAIPTITRWVDAHKASLTLVHVYNPEKTLHRDAESHLRSFYAEADNYKNCRRVLLAGETCESLAAFCEAQGEGLLFMPPSDRTGLPRPFHISNRARMLQSVKIPIWTMGKATLNTSAAVAGNHIALYVQDLDQPTDYVHAAASHAERHGATLHLLHVLPTIDEGTLISSMYSDAPLGVETACDALSQLADALPRGVRTQLHVRSGPRRRELNAMLRESNASLLMVGNRQMLSQGWLQSKINPLLDDCNIPLICLPEGMGSKRERPAVMQLSAA